MSEKNVSLDDMTLRDYFAAKAMQSMVQRDGSAYLYTISQESYKIADAMIEEREHGK